MNPGTGRNSFDWIHIAKGIGIILVVIGHCHLKPSPTYWAEIRTIIYFFHMPLFFILSGYLYSHGKYSYSSLMKNKVKRLIYPFISIAGSFFLIKYVAGQFITLWNPINIESIYALLIDPMHSFMPLLWFLHALFLIFAIYPLARLFLSNLSIMFLLLAINFFLGNDYLVFGRALSFMPFFVFGAILRESGKLSKLAIGADWRYVLAPVMMFFLAYMLRSSVRIIYDYGYPVKTFLGISGSLFVINASHAIAALLDKRTKSMLLQIGYYSMTIYLLHSLFESAVRIGFSHVFKNIQAPFELIAFISITCGIVFPLVIEKNVLRKFSITKKFVLGLD
ncbi:MAG: acyltransferase family protein [Nitrospira sp.]|nr:acyltransferase family protein [bacterium]MBL7048498.1 acyltransferase family protein [Nitrospira sp.]